jgi:hypothetical protein
MAGDIGPRQVHGGVAAFERGQIGDGHGTVGSPFDLNSTRIGIGPWRTPHQQHNLHTVPDEMLDQRSPDEAGSPAYKKLPRHSDPPNLLDAVVGTDDGVKCRIHFDAFLRQRSLLRQRTASLLLRRISRFHESWGLKHVSEKQFCERKLYQLLSKAARLS